MEIYATVSVIWLSRSWSTAWIWLQGQRSGFGLRDSMTQNKNKLSNNYIWLTRDKYRNTAPISKFRRNYMHDIVIPFLCLLHSQMPNCLASHYQRNTKQLQYMSHRRWLGVLLGQMVSTLAERVNFDLKDRRCLGERRQRALRIQPHMEWVGFHYRQGWPLSHAYACVF